MSKRVVDLKKYGAVGDGVTDDTDAVARAVRAVKRSGGTLLLPVGTYLIRGPIDFPGPKKKKQRRKRRS